MSLKKHHYSLKFFPLTSNDYKRFCWPWWKDYLNPKTYWKTVKYFCQRGYRGYADCDSWDADSYFEAVMLGVIKHLKENIHGYPCGLIDGVDDFDSPTHDGGFEKWKSILDEIIEGLEASIELRHEDTVPEGTYSSGPIEWEEVPGNPELLRMIDRGSGFNKLQYEQWQAPLLKKKKRAMLLLVKHWGSFWD